MPLTDGQVIAGYTILRSLGAGGMGEVYLAQHPRLPRRDALKVLSATVCSESEYRERFNREADVAATLWHPHIVEVHDRGDVDGQLWISMDYVEGTDAGRLLAEQFPNGMPADEVVRIVTAVADALDYAHQKGLLHRDVKPANILMANHDTDSERIMLADFGIARWIGEPSVLTGTNMTVGTVSYSAPEQLKGEEIDGRADQYALAATAFQLLTGTPPFQHSNPAVVISKHLTAAPPQIGTRRPELSSLGPVFDKALSKSPKDRYDRCIDFARALAHHIGSEDRQRIADETQLAIPATGPRHARAQTDSRHRILIGVAAALVVIAVAAIGFVLFDHTRDRSSEARPQPTSARQAPAPPADVTLPVVVVGTNCATLGAAGITESGAPAYCAHLPTTNGTIWSLYPGEISSPTATAGPNDEVYPSETEGPVLVCMEQTGKSRLECHDQIVEGNATANPTS
ncbi:serine/threonine protein kinase [Mycobacterium sp. ACS1612]|uniref:serine/threonine-protein kinase n=1 Tax=Mycobacterium sp. ACS1612 TaxID=1834117 RepID=UPI0007FCCD2B|nr:serine/threonine-protein kinase [Mycobacterium sp. ACS1612]OBF36524.1 serine/threonine protein kinase [Mycobacterium sp. ACS1612]